MRKYIVIGYTPSTYVPTGNEIALTPAANLTPNGQTSAPVTVNSNGNYFVNRSGKMLVRITSPYSGLTADHVFATINVSATLNDTAGHIGLVSPRKEITTDGQVFGPFDSKFEFTGRKIYVTFETEGSAVLTNVKIEVLQMA